MESLQTKEVELPNSQLRYCAERVERLRKRVREEEFIKKEVWGENLSILDENNRKEPLIVRKALAFKKVLSEMPIDIRDDELIIGMIRMGSVATGLPFPDYATTEEKREAARKKTSPYSVWGHTMPGYAFLLQKGFTGIQEDARGKLDELTRTNRNERRRHFYRAVVVCYDGILVLTRRYMSLAVRLAEMENDHWRRQELIKIAEVCQRISTNPPQSFHEAIQTFWFAHLALQSTLNFTPIGRFDQFMYPFLLSDLKKGVITLDKAQELIDCLWIKFNEREQSAMLSEDHSDPYAFALGGYEKRRDSRFKEILMHVWSQNIILGGQNPQGKDATNVLTYLCLNATQKLHMSNPTVSMRFFKRSPAALLERSCEVLADGYGMPIIFNDEAIVPGFQKMGVPVEETRDYTNDGCWETQIPGKTEFRYSLISAPCCLERALNRGCSRVSGKREGIETKDPYTFVSYQEVMATFKAQLDHEIKRIIDIMVDYYGCLYDIAPVPFLSSLVEDCLKDGKDITEGGAKYVVHGMLLMGLSNVADSLVAIKKLVFEENMVSWFELLKSLENNFAGREDLRQMLITRAPKYGIDSDYADGVAQEILEYFVERVQYHDRGYTEKTIRFSTGAGSVEFYVVAGEQVGATPDGRLAGTPLGANLSPSAGSAVKGLTAAINSFTKLPLIDLPIGSPLDIGVDTRTLQGEKCVKTLIAVVQSFLDKGGNIMSITAHSVEQLRAAQRDPDRYRDLIVRVAGWQAYFIDLTPKYQDAIISRIEQYGR